MYRRGGQVWRSASSLRWIAAASPEQTGTHAKSHKTQSHKPVDFWSTDVLTFFFCYFCCVFESTKKKVSSCITFWLCWTYLQIFILATFLITQSENLCCLQHGSEDTRETSLYHLVYINLIDVELWEEFPKCPFLDRSYSTCTCRHLPKLQSIGASLVTARPQRHRVIRWHQKLHAKSRVPPLFWLAGWATILPLSL